MSVHVSNDAWRNSTSTGNDLLVLLKLADNANEDTRIAWPSVGTMARYIKVDRRTIQRCLRRLELTGEITAEGDPYHAAISQSSIRYRVNCEGGGILPPGGGASAAGGAAPMPPEPSVEPSTQNPLTPPGEIQRVFDAWTESTGRTRTALDVTRRGLIRRRLKTYPVEDLIAAVQGWDRDPWCRGENPDGKKYNDLEFLLRISSRSNNVERFRNLALGTEQTIDRTSVKEFLAR